jgi:hypothetical protein
LCSIEHWQEVSSIPHAAVHEVRKRKHTVFVDECIRPSLYDYPNYLKAKIYKTDVRLAHQLVNALYANKFMQGRELIGGGNPKNGPINCTVHPIYGRKIDK